nr:transposase [Thorsellia anophelis]
MNSKGVHVHSQAPCQNLLASCLMRSLKGVSSGLFRHDSPAINARYYYKGVQWTLSCFASSSAGAPIAII